MDVVEEESSGREEESLFEECSPRSAIRKAKELAISCTNTSQSDALKISRCSIRRRIRFKRREISLPKRSIPIVLLRNREYPDEIDFVTLMKKNLKLIFMVYMSRRRLSIRN